MAAANSKSVMPSDDAIYGAVSALKLVADTTRLKVLFLLEQRAYNVGELCEMLSHGQPAISHHLTLLRVAGIVERSRKGKTNVYELSDLGRFAVIAARKLMAH